MIAIYARQSVNKMDSISIETQIEECEKELRKGEKASVYFDKGYSGKNIDRPEFQRLLEDIRLGTVNKVVCYKLDRVSRSVVDFAMMMETFARYKVDFVSCNEKFDTSTPMGRAMLNICIVFAQLERETIQQRVIDAYCSRSRKGFYMGGRCPYGYRVEEYVIDGIKTSHYVVVPEEAEVLKLMYSMYAQLKGWKMEVISSNPTELGGYKEISFMIEGEGAYSRFKYESGVHRVQRVPDTETQGRIHTSTVTVAVMPEADEVEVDINPADLKIDTFRSSGAGGQHINKTSSAIRVTHIPTGTVVECQDERSQFKNKDKALKMLRAKLYDIKQTEQSEKIASERRSQVGTGDRSERIRTYNYPQGRVTDHRIGLTLYNLAAIVGGDIQGIIDQLIIAENAERLKESEM